MTQGIEITGLAATIALLIPLAVLATLIALVLRRRRKAPAVEEVTTTQAALATASAEVAQADDLVARAAAVARAESAGEERALPRLYLSLGEAQRGRGLGEEARRSLTRAIRIAAQSGDKDTHAAARLGLGDLAQAAGDLTTACEHWQIARALFQELGGVQSLAETEARMRRNGCPTDWVLNDF